MAAACCVLVVLGSSVPRALAQTGPELLLRPFRNIDQFEFNADALFHLPTQTGNPDPGGGFYRYRSDILDLSGRLRLTPGLSEEGFARAQPRAGFQARYINLDTLDPALPRDLFDGSVAVGMGVLALDGWIGAISLGVGHAGANFERDANALYFQGNFVVGKVFQNQVDAFGIVLDYNGNRSFLPDWPLIGFQYRTRIDRPRTPARRPAAEGPNGPVPPFERYDPTADPPRFVLAVGFPYMGVEIRPLDRLTLEATFAFPDNLSFRGDYILLGDQETQGVGVYASLSRTVNAFHWNALPDGRDRLIFRHAQAEGGLNWRIHERAELVISAGWAFGRRFDVGFDTRDTTHLTDIEAGPYGRAQFRLRL